MTAPITPYTNYLGDRDPLAAIRDNLDRIAGFARGWASDRFERSYAPGKWSARQILTHLAQTEMALGARARMTLTTPQYVAQAFDQDSWVAREPRMSGPEALEAFLAIGRMNLVFFEGLSAADRATSLSHPEYGSLTIDWILHQMAGHQINHLRQLEAIAA
jgi:hypothetical protein